MNKMQYKDLYQQARSLYRQWEQEFIEDGYSSSEAWQYATKDVSDWLNKQAQGLGEHFLVGYSDYMRKCEPNEQMIAYARRAFKQKWPYAVAAPDRSMCYLPNNAKGRATATAISHFALD